MHNISFWIPYFLMIFHGLDIGLSVFFFFSEIWYAGHDKHTLCGYSNVILILNVMHFPTKSSTHWYYSGFKSILWTSTQYVQNIGLSCECSLPVYGRLCVLPGQQFVRLGYRCRHNRKAHTGGKHTILILPKAGTLIMKLFKEAPVNHGASTQKKEIPRHVRCWN